MDVAMRSSAKGLGHQLPFIEPHVRIHSDDPGRDEPCAAAERCAPSQSCHDNCRGANHAGNQLVRENRPQPDQARHGEQPGPAGRLAGCTRGFGQREQALQLHVHIATTVRERECTTVVCQRVGADRVVAHPDDVHDPGRQTYERDDNNSQIESERRRARSYGLGDGWPRFGSAARTRSRERSIAVQRRDSQPDFHLDSAPPSAVESYARPNDSGCRSGVPGAPTPAEPVPKHIVEIMRAPCVWTRR